MAVGTDHVASSHFEQNRFPTLFRYALGNVEHLVRTVIKVRTMIKLEDDYIAEFV